MAEGLGDVPPSTNTLAGGRVGKDHDSHSVSYPYSMSAVRAVVVADDPLGRASLAALLAEQPDCDLLGQLAPDSELLDTIDVYHPDVVLWDLGWEPELGDVLDRLGELRETGTPVVALLPATASVPAVWATGAQGLLLRDVSAEELVAALAAAAHGTVVLDPSLAEGLLPSSTALPPALPEPLTPREVEVLRFLGEGLPNKAISELLYISENTVKFHISAVMGKMGARTRTEVVVRASRLGLLPL